MPVGYLKNFTSEGGTLYGYDKYKGRTFSLAKPKSVAFAWDFHTVPHPDDPAILERRLGRQFEAPALRLIKELTGRVREKAAGQLAGPIASLDNRRELARFAGLQLMRTKKQRDLMLQETKEHRFHGVTMPDEELARLAHLRLLEVYMADDFDIFVQLIGRHRLMFLSASKSKPFWITDHPVVVTRGGAGTKVDFGGIGLIEENLELHLPLTSDVMAVFVGAHIRRGVPEHMPVASGRKLPPDLQRSGIRQCPPLPLRICTN